MIVIGYDNDDDSDDDCDNDSCSDCFHDNARDSISSLDDYYNNDIKVIVSSL